MIDLSKHIAAGMGIDSVSGVEAVIGSGSADNIKGDKQANALFGGAGDDTLRGLGGADKLSGGAGKDTFVYFGKDVVNKTGAYLGLDHVTDFASGDRLDLRGMVKGKLTADMVRMTNGSDGTTVSIKMGDHFVDVVTLDGVHSHDLVSHGLLLG